MAAWQHSDFENHFLSLLWKGNAETVLLGFHRKGKGEGSKKDWFPKTVFLLQFLYTKEKWQDRSRGGSPMPWTQLPCRQTGWKPPPFHHAPGCSVSNPNPLPNSTNTLFCCRIREASLGHSFSARTPPVICNISLATRGTSAPCSGLDYLHWVGTDKEKVDIRFEDTFSISTDSLQWRPRKIKYSDCFSIKIVVLKICICFLGALAKGSPHWSCIARLWKRKSRLCDMLSSLGHTVWEDNQEGLFEPKRSCEKQHIHGFLCDPLI